jgi:hypothetical protein
MTDCGVNLVLLGAILVCIGLFFVALGAVL